MKIFDGFCEVGFFNMGVNLRGGNVAVAKGFLKQANIAGFVVNVSCKRVANFVGRNFCLINFANMCKFF